MGTDGEVQPRGRNSSGATLQAASPLDQGASKRKSLLGLHRYVHELWLGGPCEARLCVYCNEQVPTPPLYGVRDLDAIQQAS